MLSKDRYLESFTADAADLIDAAVLEPMMPVVHCGDWTTSDLVAHLCGVWEFLDRHVRTRATEREGSMRSSDLMGGELFTRARTLAARLASTLADVDPDEPVWSWTADKTGGFYLRRAAQETSVHAWDMRTAVGRIEPIPSDIARDGIDELADSYHPSFLRRGKPEPIGSLHLHCTDGPGEWTLHVDDGSVVVQREHAKGDVAVRGTASDLDLLLWNRVAADDDALEVFGDIEVLTSWTALTG